MNITNKIIYKFLLFLFFGVSVSAQELSVGSDLVSRYIWRGSDLGANSASIQPAIEFSASEFAMGFWAALPIANPDALEEIDFYARYSINFDNSGSLSIGFTDYMNPNSGTEIGNFNNYDDPGGPGAHFLEANLSYSGHNDFPLYLAVNMFFYNVPNNPIYLETGYHTSISDINFDIFLGGTPGDAGKYYGAKNFSVVNSGIKVSKEIKISESFALPIFCSVILNPESESLFYVFGISIN